MEAGNLNELLREFRVKSGYTQQQIADILNCSRSTYTYYETGKTLPDIDTLLVLARIYNVPVGLLLHEEPPKQLLSDWKRPKKIRANTSHIFDLNEQEIALVGAFRALTPQEQKEFLKQTLSKRKKLDKIE